MAPDFNGPDGKNEIDFGPIDDPNVLAFVNLWGHFDSYPLSQRYIIEWDMRFNQDKDWGDASFSPLVYHFPGVFVHECGHTLWLADVYSPGGIDCSLRVIMEGVSPRGKHIPDSPQPEDLYSFFQLYSPILADNVQGNATRLTDYWEIWAFTLILLIAIV